MLPPVTPPKGELGSYVEAVPPPKGGGDLGSYVEAIPPKGGDLGSYTEAVTSAATATGDILTPVNGVIPELGNHAHIWGWAAEAFGPENATKALHAMTSRADAANHVVEWHGIGKEQWLRLDGHTDVGYLYKTLLPFAK